MLLPYDPSEFYPIDLMWEATRRNELYKKEYAEFVSEDAASEGNLLHSGLRWGIYPKLFNPDITIYEIKGRIEAGEKLEVVHPYWRQHADSFQPVMVHKLPEGNAEYINLDGFDSISDGFVYHTFRTGSQYACIMRNRLENRLICSINPFANKEEIKSKSLP